MTSTCLLAWRWVGEEVFDSQLWAKALERVVVKLLPVIQDQDSRDLVSADDVPPDKTPYVLFCDEGQGFSFYPFGEVVYADY